MLPFVRFSTRGRWNQLSIRRCFSFVELFLSTAKHVIIARNLSDENDGGKCYFACMAKREKLASAISEWHRPMADLASRQIVLYSPFIRLRDAKNKTERRTRERFEDSLTTDDSMRSLSLHSSCRLYLKAAITRRLQPDITFALFRLHGDSSVRRVKCFPTGMTRC